MASTIARERCEALSVGEFHSRYMLPNRPVLIDISSLTASWKATTEWCTAAGDGRRVVNTEKLRELFAGVDVTTHDCASRVMGRLRTNEMSLADYLEWYAAHGAGAVGAAGAGGGGERGGDGRLLYLKDWNFAREQPVGCCRTHLVSMLAHFLVLSAASLHGRAHPARCVVAAAAGLSAVRLSGLFQIGLAERTRSRGRSGALPCLHSSAGTAPHCDWRTRWNSGSGGAGVSRLTITMVDGQAGPIIALCTLGQLEPSHRSTKVRRLNALPGRFRSHCTDPPRLQSPVRHHGLSRCWCVGHCCALLSSSPPLSSSLLTSSLLPSSPLDLSSPLQLHPLAGALDSNSGLPFPVATR